MLHPAQLLLVAGVLAAPAVLSDTMVRTALQAAEAARQAPPEDSDGVEVSILRLKNVRYRQGRPLPKWVRALDGKRIRMWGYMAVGTLEGLENFELVPESCECGRSKVNHFVEVSLTDDVTRFIPGRITLTGVFHAGEEKEDGFITSLYRLSTPALPD